MHVCTGVFVHEMFKAVCLSHSRPDHCHYRFMYVCMYVWIYVM